MVDGVEKPRIGRKLSRVLSIFRKPKVRFFLSFKGVVVEFNKMILTRAILEAQTLRQLARSQFTKSLYMGIFQRHRITFILTVM